MMYAPNPPCQFTCCFCCKYGYDASCVYSAAYGFDAILFGLWTIQALGTFSNSNAGLYVLINLAFALVLLVITVFAIIHLCNKNKYMAQGILKQKNEFYLKLRLGFCIFLGIMALVLFIVYLVVVQAALKDQKDAFGGRAYTDSAATAGALSVAFGVAIPLIIDIIVLFGYRQSFLDSVERLSNVNPQGPRIGGGLPAAYPLQQPAYMSQPQQNFQPFHGQGVAIGAGSNPNGAYQPPNAGYQSNPAYQPPNQAYQPPPPLPPAPTPYRDPTFNKSPQAPQEMKFADQGKGT